MAAMPNDKLKQAREATGMTQAAVAEAIGKLDAPPDGALSGLDWSTIEEWETNRHQPCPWHRFLLEQVLGRSAAELGLMAGREGGIGYRVEAETQGLHFDTRVGRRKALAGALALGVAAMLPERSQAGAQEGTSSRTFRPLNFGTVNSHKEAMNSVQMGAAAEPYVLYNTPVPDDNITTTPIFTITPPSRAPFTFSTWSSGPQADGTYDHWVGMGFNANIQSTAGPVPGQPALYMGFEDGWESGVSEGMEWYIAYWSPDHTSVQLFRPFYCRVQRDNNTQHNAHILLDIGTDGVGTFEVTAGGFAPIFTVTSRIVTWKPNTVGSSTFILDTTGAGYTSALLFRNNAANGFTIESVAPNVLTIVDPNGRPQTVFSRGANATAALTTFSSSVAVQGRLVVGSAVLATTARDGFLYIPTCAGMPTGAPTAQTGTAPIVLDTANSKLWVNVGGPWKGVAVA